MQDPEGGCILAQVAVHTVVRAGGFTAVQAVASIRDRVEASTAARVGDFTLGREEERTLDPVAVSTKDRVDFSILGLAEARTRALVNNGLAIGHQFRGWLKRLAEDIYTAMLEFLKNTSTRRSRLSMKMSCFGDQAAPRLSPRARKEWSQRTCLLGIEVNT